MPLSAMFALLLPLAILTATPSPSMLCIYDGELYAKATVEQEFADAAWVGRVRVASAVNNWPADDPNWDGEPWTLYQVQVVQTFKGEAVTELSVFTWRNSGGFYMDRLGGGHDIGGEYLLFLNPGEPDALPPHAHGARVVNYSCGRSGPWRDVPEADRRFLVQGG